MTEPNAIDINLQQAAAGARQLVSEKLQLQALHRVLDDLAGKQQLVNELNSKVAKATAELQRLNSELELVRTNHSAHLREIEVSTREREVALQGRIGALSSEGEVLERRKSALLADIAAEESRLAAVRAALAGASAAAGIDRA